jgi:hypothetical protein
MSDGIQQGLAEPFHFAVDCSRLARLTGGLARDRHHPGARFILEDPEEVIRLVIYSDSDLRWEHTGAGINIAFRVKEE